MTDETARLLTKGGQTTAGYNVQIAVDAKHKLIVGNDATNEGNDSQQLAPMAEQVKATLAVEQMVVVADAGYYEGEQIKRCEDQNITCYVAIPDKSKTIKGQGRYPREVFCYDPEKNIYVCPQGKTLRQQGKPYAKRHKQLIRYISKASECKHCPCRSRCLAGKSRTRSINRWEHEGVIERHVQRMKNGRAWMRQRSGLVEHPFGTLKRRAGWDHFLVRGFEKVRGELGLMVLGYNFTRVLNIIGIQALQEYCIQRTNRSLRCSV